MYYPSQIAFAVRCTILSAALLAPGLPAYADLPDPTRFRIKMEMGVMDQAREWLDAGMPVDFMGDRIGSGLMIAAWEGNLALMELFVQRGARVDAVNSLGETALMHAAWKGHLNAVRWLLERGANTDPKQESLQWTALHYAAFAGHDEIAELLLDKGANINARSPNGSSVLMMAIYEGRENMSRWLLARGADPRVRNENGDGALDWAMKFNHLNIARMVATQEEFVAAASRPKQDWGPVQKSAPIPKDMEELLAMREILVARKLSVAKIDQRIAAMRARYAREAMRREAPPPVATLEISAERKAPQKQQARMIYDAPRAKPQR